MSAPLPPGLSDLLSAGAICTRIVSTVDVGTSVVAAARIMRESHVGCVVVIEDPARTSRVVGLLTDRDIAVSAVALDLDVRRLRVGDLMSRDVVAAREADPLGLVLERMREAGVRRIPVLSDAGALVGLISFDDLQAALALQVRAMTEVLVVGRLNEAAQQQ